MFGSIPCICIVGFVVIMSLSGLHSLVERVRFGALIGGRMNLWSLGCVKLIHDLYVAMMSASCLFCKNLRSTITLWSRVMLSWWRSCEASTHFVMWVGGVFFDIDSVVLWPLHPIYLYMLWC